MNALVKNLVALSLVLGAIACSGPSGPATSTPPDLGDTAQALDSDGDGVPDRADQCPGQTLDPDGPDVALTELECNDFTDCYGDDAEHWADGTAMPIVSFPAQGGVTGPATPLCIQALCAWERDTDGAAGADACDPDNDGDGHLDEADNCPNVANGPEQMDTPAGNQRNTDAQCDPEAAAPWDTCVADELGDACDPDDDGDGVLDCGADGICGTDDDDNCRLVPNPGQADTDGNGQGDACDGDIDGDGVPNCGADGTCGNDDDDNCVMDANPDQADFDGDGQGDVCDLDDDNDGDPDASDCADFDPTIFVGQDEVCDGIDNNCDGEVDEGFANTDAGGPNDQGADCIDPDDDGDTIPDASDNCQLVANVDQLDTDHDGIGDACDPDMDDDGVENADDLCPLHPDPQQTDADGDGLGDVCDPDCDGDDLFDMIDFVDMVQLDERLPSGTGNPFCVAREELDFDGDGWCPNGVDLNDDNDCLDANERGQEGGTYDCNDGSARVNPDMDEACDGIDNNCDGQVDEGGDALCGDAGGVCLGLDGCDFPNNCVPQCEGMACGPDGCGGSCGQCGAGQQCNAGACEDLPPECVQHDDCPAGANQVPVCNAGVCEVCVRQCGDGDQCGNDGCGGTCGNGCVGGQICDGAHQCVDPLADGQMSMVFAIDIAQLPAGTDEVRFFAECFNAAGGSLPSLPWRAHVIVAALPAAGNLSMKIDVVDPAIHHCRANVLFRGAGQNIRYAVGFVDGVLDELGNLSYSLFDGASLLQVGSVGTAVNPQGNGGDFVFAPGTDSDGDGTPDNGDAAPRNPAIQ